MQLDIGFGPNLAILIHLTQPHRAMYGFKISLNLIGLMNFNKDIYVKTHLTHSSLPPS